MPRLPFVPVAGALGVALLAGCANLEEQVQEVMGDRDEELRTAAFDCDDDQEFRVRLSGDREEARVDAGDERYELDLEDRDDGRYLYTNDDGVQLEISNEEAYLRIPGEADFQDCERS